MNPLDLVKSLSGLQGQLKDVQDKLNDIVAWGSSGGNMVRVALNGRFDMVDIKLDPICVDNRDVPMLEDLIKAAYSDAMAKIQERIQSQLGPMISGLNLNIPGVSG